MPNSGGDEFVVDLIDDLQSGKHFALKPKLANAAGGQQSEKGNATFLSFANHQWKWDDKLMQAGNFELLTDFLRRQDWLFASHLQEKNQFVLF